MKAAETERKLRKFKIDADLSSVEVKFEEVITVPPSHQENDPLIRTVPYTVESPYRPKKQLIDCLKKLRKHALEILEIDVDTKHIGLYNVIALKITGDVLTKTSRVVLTLAKVVERTGKVVKITLPQVTMYGQSEYVDAEKMSVIVEDLIEEIWQYLGGEVDAEQLQGADPSQLALFPSMAIKPLDTHFVK